ncbi:Pr6Pr family membrane protein [Pedobacter miscanthi]|uniref:Pr6Pr family membrane protein n=1 Tax=Pedobacter miscanthi TaxID=2259170 RepID=UPI0029310107|nr:Pr6Pr family membrane protein [Pedobacter miscanthi]
MKSSANAKFYVAIAALVIWFSIGLQFTISLKLTDYNYPETLKVFLSYFTVSTNIIVAICFTALSFAKKSDNGSFFTKSGTLTAITVYIVVVGLIYNTMLRGLMLLNGWPRVADELLHVVSPIIFLIFWIFYVDKSHLRYKSALKWLIYPLIYVIFTVIRGYFINRYPYPFIDVVQLGYPTAILNAAIIIFIFWLLSLFFIFIGRKTTKA